MNNYNCIIDFYQSIDLYNKDYFDLIKEKTTILKGEYEEIRDFIGFYPKYKNNKLIDFKLYLPELIGIENILIYIHEYCHALFPEDKTEILPNIIEAKFIKEYINIPKITNDIIEKTKIKIKKTESVNHKIGQTIKINYLKSLK